MGAEGWIPVAIVVSAGVLGMMYTLSGNIRDFHRVVALRAEIDRLRSQYAERMAAQRAYDAMHGIERGEDGAVIKSGAHKR